MWLFSWFTSKKFSYSVRKVGLSLVADLSGKVESSTQVEEVFVFLTQNVAGMFNQGFSPSSFVYNLQGVSSISESAILKLGEFGVSNPESVAVLVCSGGHLDQRTETLLQMHCNYRAE